MSPDGAEALRQLGMVELKPDHGLDIRRMSDITARPVRWLWPGRIASGKVTMLAGHPGLGKSQLALAIAAIVSTRGQWPVDGACAECGSIVILSAEDDPEDTIRPRLDAAGADLARCHVIGAVRGRDNTGRETRRGFSILEDVPRLATALAGMVRPRWWLSTRSQPIWARRTAIVTPRCAPRWHLSPIWRRNTASPCWRYRTCANRLTVRQFCGLARFCGRSARRIYRYTRSSG